jgi:hypothetical protein
MSVTSQMCRYSMLPHDVMEWSQDCSHRRVTGITGRVLAAVLALSVESGYKSECYSVVWALEAVM